MTSTEATVPPGDVSGLDVRETLLEAAAERRQADRSEANLLRLAIQIVHLYPVDDDTCTATWHPTASLLDDPAAVAGEGTPLVAEQAVEELGAALDLSYRAALSLVAEALELAYRLPRLWALVQDGRLQAWKARQVAALTTHLSREAAAFVDRQAAIAGAKNRIVPNLTGLIQETLIRFDPDLAKGLEDADLAHREVTFQFHGETVGSASLTATLDLMDALDLDATVSDVATQMGRLGDESPLGHRRAHALGLLAQPQRVLDLFGDASGNQQGLSSTGATLYFHIEVDDLRAAAAGTPSPGRFEKLGTATLDLLHGWLQRTGQLTIKPVLDMQRNDAVDHHDPPEWMRDLVILRDRHCVFPGCNVDARICDLDHTIPYIPIDDGGPPGQTNPANLACLCRRHHRLKTFTAWRYQRASPCHYIWSNPYGLTYRSRLAPKR